MSTSLSGPVECAFHTTAPVSALSAAIQPRTPNSPPLLPTSTLSFTTSGAIVSVSPRLMSPRAADQRSAPDAASTASVRLSSVLKYTAPSAYTAPRLTTSQQATPLAAEIGLGSCTHFTGAPGFVRSSAYSMFGQGVTTYIVSFTTSGAASWPATTPVEKVKTTPRRLTFSRVICVR